MPRDAGEEELTPVFLDVKGPINPSEEVPRDLPTAHAFPAGVVNLDDTPNSSSSPQNSTPRLDAQPSSSPPPKTVQFDLPSRRSSASSWEKNDDEGGYESDDSDTTVEDAKSSR